MMDSLNDIVLHVAKQKLDLNVVRMGNAFYKQHKNIYGSFPLTEENFPKIQQRYNWIKSKLWDVIESKIESDKYHKKLGIEYNNWR